MKNVETYIPAIVEQLSGEPDLSSLDEPMEVWEINADVHDDEPSLPTMCVCVFPSEEAAWEFRGRFSKWIINAGPGPLPTTLAHVLDVAKRVCQKFGYYRVLMLNGKGEVLRTWEVE